jgi:hypothetical protein
LGLLRYYIIVEETMKKIYDNWRGELLNEFAPSYGIEDEEAGIEQYITPTSELIQAAIQAAIDDSRGYHASGRAIDSRLLQGLLKENNAKELVESIRSNSDDYIRKLNMTEEQLRSTKNDLTNLRRVYNWRFKAPIAGNNLPVADLAFSRYLNGLFMDKAKFQQYKENIENATEALGSFLESKRYKIIHAIRLFTGESVSTVRDPSKFDPRYAKLMSQGDGMSLKLGTLRSFLPDDITVTNKDSIRFDGTEILLDIVEHVMSLVSPTIKFELEEITSDKGRERLTNYFDRITDIVKKIKAEEPEILADVPYQKRTMMSIMSAKISHSTRSGRFLEFMKSIERVKTMLPIYLRFFDNFVKFLGKPTKDDYESANKILKTMARRKVNGDYQIYRGMYLKGDARPEALEKGMEFDFYEISSWSTSAPTAHGFISPSDGKRGTGDLKLLFSMKAKRGTYIDFYSAFNGEQEFITGGKVRVLDIIHKTLHTEIVCEQL